MSKLFYTALDVSEILNIPKRTILDYAKNKIIVSQNLHGRYIFSKLEILRYAKKNMPEFFSEVEKRL